MSAGGFNTTRYQANNGVIHPIRIQPETAALVIGGTTNTIKAVEAGETKSQISARVNGSRRGFGLFTRIVRVQFGDTDGAAPDGYQTGGTISLPILTSDFYDAISAGDTGTYLDKVITVTGLAAEVSR